MSAVLRRHSDLSARADILHETFGSQRACDPPAELILVDADPNGGDRSAADEAASGETTVFRDDDVIVLALAKRADAYKDAGVVGVTAPSSSATMGENPRRYCSDCFAGERGPARQRPGGRIGEVLLLFAQPFESPGPHEELPRAGRPRL